MREKCVDVSLFVRKKISHILVFSITFVNISLTCNGASTPFEPNYYHIG